MLISRGLKGKYNPCLFPLHALTLLGFIFRPTVASLLPKWIRRQFQAWKSVPLKPRNEASHPQPQGLTLSNECVCLEEADPFSRNAREAGGEPPEGLHILMEAVEIFFSSQ